MKSDYSLTENTILSRKLSCLRDLVCSRASDCFDDEAVFCTLRAIMYRLEDCVSDLVLLESAIENDGIKK